MMWSQSVPSPSHRGSCPVASHRPCARCFTCRLMLAQLLGSRELRSLVDQATSYHHSSLSQGRCASVQQRSAAMLELYSAPHDSQVTMPHR
jgi:hypothetical protein